MAELFPPCAKRYITDQRGARWRLNVVPVTVEAVKYPDQTLPGTVYRLYFPKPFIILGTTKTLDADSPNLTSFSYAYSKLDDPGLQSLYAAMPMALFMDLAYANTHDLTVGSVVNYIEPGNQGVDYRGYFSKYLNPQTLIFDNLNDNYYSMNAPGSVIRQFMESNIATTQAAWLDKFYQLVEFLEQTSDINLLGAPGVYGFSLDGGGIQPDWNGETNYRQVEND